MADGELPRGMKPVVAKARRWKQIALWYAQVSGGSSREGRRGTQYIYTGEVAYLFYSSLQLLVYLSIAVWPIPLLRAVPKCASILLVAASLEAVGADLVGTGTKQIQWTA